MTTVAALPSTVSLHHGENASIGHRTPMRDTMDASWYEYACQCTLNNDIIPNMNTWELPHRFTLDWIPLDIYVPNHFEFRISSVLGCVLDSSVCRRLPPSSLSLSLSHQSRIRIASNVARGVELIYVRDTATRCQRSAGSVLGRCCCWCMQVHGKTASCPLG